MRDHDPDLKRTMSKVKEAIYSQVVSSIDDMLRTENNSLHFGKAILAQGLAISRAIDEGRVDEAQAMQDEYGMQPVDNYEGNECHYLRLALPQKVIIISLRRQAR